MLASWIIDARWTEVVAAGVGQGGIGFAPLTPGSRPGLPIWRRLTPARRERFGRWKFADQRSETTGGRGSGGWTP
jgi:hypothetical protein